MKKIMLLLLLSISILANLYSQKTLVFLNTKTNKIIEVEEGQTLSINFKGYNNQIFHFKNTVTTINDSIVVLGEITDELPTWAQKLNKKYEPNYRIVNIKDIVSFRKISIGKSLGKSLINTGVLIGTFIFSVDLVKYNNLSVWQTILLSFGIGAGTSVINSFVLPENPNNKVEGTWVVSVKN
jgi:hypothetical protein